MKHKKGLIVESATSFKTKVNMAPIEPLPKQGTTPIAYRDCKNKSGTCDEAALNRPQMPVVMGILCTNIRMNK